MPPQGPNASQRQPTALGPCLGALALSRCLLGPLGPAHEFPGQPTSDRTKPGSPKAPQVPQEGWKEGGFGEEVASERSQRGGPRLDFSFLPAWPRPPPCREGGIPGTSQRRASPPPRLQSYVICRECTFNSSASPPPASSPLPPAPRPCSPVASPSLPTQPCQASLVRGSAGLPVTQEAGQGG